MDKVEARRRFAHLVSGQFGVFTRAQARAHGYSDTMIRTRLRAEAWAVVRGGLYRVVTTPVTWTQRAMAAQLAGGDAAFVSHTSAARLLAIETFADCSIHLSTMNHMRPWGEIKVHRVRRPPTGDLQTIGPFLVSSPTRLLLEMAPLVTSDDLELALDEILRRRFSSLARIRWRLDRTGAKGMPGATRLRKLIREREPGPIPESVLERTFMRVIVRAHLPAPERQLVVRDQRGFVGRVDFAYPQNMILVEVDSFAFHSGRIRWEEDRTRRNRLEAAGWRVLHTTYDQLRNRPQAILEPLRKLLSPSLPGTRTS
jgi:very-short-patch-repair endonuclease